jgi:hypothetical protein
LIWREAGPEQSNRMPLRNSTSFKDWCNWAGDLNRRAEK